VFLLAGRKTKVRPRRLAAPVYENEALAENATVYSAVRIAPSRGRFGLLAVTAEDNLCYAIILAFILEKNWTRTNILSRGDKKILVVSTLISFRIPLYCKVDKLTNLTIYL
jgi:hypothetical protein